MGYPEQDLQIATGDIGRAFVERYYANEKPVFGKVWTSFQELLLLRPGQVPETRALRDWATGVPAAVGLDAEEQPDLVTPIVLATVASVLGKLHKQDPTDVQLGLLVTKVAASFGARGELLARLTQHLPALCKSVATARTDVFETEVTRTQKTQYQIWTEGGEPFEGNIADYENRKPEILFWIDLRTGLQCSRGIPQERLPLKAVELLIYLVERLGLDVPLVDVLRSVWGDNITPPNVINVSDRNKIAQQITKLNNFSNGEFHDHYFRTPDGSGIGISESFAKLYFIFRRLP